MNIPRIVITGLGAMTPIGIGKDAFWNSLIAGKHGFAPIESIDVSDYPIQIGAEIKDLPEYQGDRAIFFAREATRLALEDAGLDQQSLPRETAVIIGTSSGNQDSVEKINQSLIQNEEPDPENYRYMSDDYLSICISKELAVEGMSMVISTACSSGNHAISLGVDQLRTGRAKMAIVGGSDSYTRVLMTVFHRLSALTPDICRPFDLNRSGIIIGEGAGILVLETLESALARNAHIYCEVLGYGLACDVNSPTAPDPEGRGVMEAMDQILRFSGIQLSDVNYISAHGTGTPLNDKIETAAMQRIFGDLFPNIPMSSIKSMIGHTMGAASALEAIVCAMVIEKGMIPPTINYQTPDPECNVDMVPGEAREHQVSVALSNSFAFGGSIGIMAFGRVDR